jgi:hypothetical protein
MKFKVGDKVNFLNESGGGVITAVIDSRMVKVEVEGGFEMPVLTSELILDYRAKELEEIEKEYNRPVVSSSVKEEPEEEPESERISEISPFRSVKEEKGIYLVYEPHDQQWLLTGELDLFLVNHTSYDILYSLFLEQEGVMKGIDYGSVPPESKIVIETLDRDHLDDWSKGFLQILFHHDEPQNILLPLHSKINVKVGRFYKEGSYVSNTLVGGKALVVNISPEAALEKEQNSLLAQKHGVSSKKTDAQEVKEIPLIDKHRTGSREAVVDLHIGELVDNISGLSGSDMLEIQMNYFKKVLESAIVNDYEKVTFIHGVGNGVLKNAIIREIDQYEGLEGRMASITKFGVGAIDIHIKLKDF